MRMGRAAKMEALLEKGINDIGYSDRREWAEKHLLWVLISRNTARHPSAIGVAVNVGCWSPPPRTHYL